MVSSVASADPLAFASIKRVKEILPNFSASEDIPLSIRWINARAVCFLKKKDRLGGSYCAIEVVFIYFARNFSGMSIAGSGRREPGLWKWLSPGLRGTVFTGGKIAVLSERHWQRQKSAKSAKTCRNKLPWKSVEVLQYLGVVFFKSNFGLGLSILCYNRPWVTEVSATSFGQITFSSEDP